MKGVINGECVWGRVYVCLCDGKVDVLNLSLMFCFSFDIIITHDSSYFFKAIYTFS